MVTSSALKSRARALRDLVVSWELALLRTWSTMALAGLGLVGAASAIWQVVHSSLLFDLILAAENGGARKAQILARSRLVTWAAAALGIALIHWVYHALRAR